MTQRPWMPLYVNDYLAAVGHLTLAEQGAYMRLMLVYWQKGGLPESEALIQRLSGMTTDEWANSREVLASFFGPGWKHERIEKELADAVERSEKGAELSRKRWAKKEQPQPETSDTQSGTQCDTHTDTQSGGDAAAMLLHTSHFTEISTSVDIPPSSPQPVSKPSRKRRLDVDALPPDWRDFALREGVDDPEAMWLRFSDYWRGEGKPKADWFATWRNWVRRDVESKSNGRNAQPQMSKHAAAVVKLLRAEAGNLPGDGGGNPRLTGPATGSGLVVETARETDGSLPPARRAWGG